MRDGCNQVVVANEGDLKDQRILPERFPTDKHAAGYLFLRHVMLCRV